MEKLHFSIWIKAPKEKVWQFPAEDISWKQEWKNFRSGFLDKKPVMSSGAENVEVLKVIDGLYKSAATGRLIKI